MIALPARPALMLWYSVLASSPRTSPMTMADSPSLRDTRRASSERVVTVPWILSSTSMVWTL